MPRVLVWKCPHTGKLFEDEKEYRSHLKELSRQRIQQRKWKAILDNLVEIIEGAQNVSNAQELVDYIINNQQSFIIYGLLNDSFKYDAIGQALKQGWEITFPRIESLCIVTSWSDSVSNSHVCPRNGYTNWGGSVKDGVRGYPGWRGKVEMAYSEDNYHIHIKKPNKKKPIIYEAPSISTIGSRFGASTSLSGINAGSGGGGKTSQRYGLSLFLDDFPMMKQQLVLLKIKGDEKAINALGVGGYPNVTT